MSSSDDFFKGLIFGVTVGAVAGILLAPKPGVETREDIKKLAIDLGDRATDIYKDARRRVRRKIKNLRETGENIDLESYKKLVKEVVDEFRNDTEVSSDVAKKLGEKLNEDWNEIKGSIMA